MIDIPVNTAERLMRLYRSKGSKLQLQNSISEMDYSYQLAILAVEDGQDDEVVLAAFYNNFAKLITEKSEDPGYEKTIQALKNLGFSPKILKIIKDVSRDESQSLVKAKFEKWKTLSLEKLNVQTDLSFIKQLTVKYLRAS
ncbi:hypothetical protein [Mangrovivirga cuniculi]|uniref:Uncharacterized protein n=1 Tax=Mangrovivirga cuniculi TaxID=2715131 RepID=A0A4D7JIB9_9BACT|nr:hypothetical protein [Mangrovivirga cuniculi]QCK14733.1 hypothetical protein DCC35_08260 [Mangrovivirga cuniculi]